MPAITRREEYAALTRAALIGAARELFVTTGYGATTIDAIAAHARASKGAVYHHFSDKKAIFEQVLIDEYLAARSRIAHYLGQVSAVAGPRAAALAAVSESLTAMAGDPRTRVIVAQMNQALGSQRVTEIDEQYGVPFVIAILHQLSAAGELRDDVDTGSAARLLCALIGCAVSAVSLADSPETALLAAQSTVTQMFSGLLRPAGAAQATV